MCCCRPPGFAVPPSLCHHRQLLNRSAAESCAALCSFSFNSPSLHPSPAFLFFLLVGIEFQNLGRKKEHQLFRAELGVCCMLCWPPLLKSDFYSLFCSTNPRSIFSKPRMLNALFPINGKGSKTNRKVIIVGSILQVLYKLIS